MPDQPYARPPITEAIIQVAFRAAVSEADLRKASNRFSDLYPQYQMARNYHFELVMPPKPDARPRANVREESGHKRTSDDETKIIILWPTSFIFSQLTPYPGWENFFQRFVRDWELWKRVVGHQHVIRIGVRYINRIDIPITRPVVDYESFLSIYPKLPDELGPVSAYGIQTETPLPEIGGKVIINSASVPSPLLNHLSFMFDQDLIKETNLPQNDEGIYKLLNEIHIRKNAIFEACITNRARELFNR